MQSYPKHITEEPKDLAYVLKIISRLREEDITDRDSFDSVYMRGRKVGKIPIGSSDVIAADREGDFSFDANYMYLLVNNSGTAEWRRISLGSW